MEHLKRESRQTVLLIFLFVLALAAVDTAVVKTSFIVPFNMAVFSVVNSVRLSLPWLTYVMIGVTLLGSDPVLLVFVIALAVRNARQWLPGESTWFLLVVIVGRVTVLVAKAAVESPRPRLIEVPPPFNEFSGYGYPSGHALMSTVVLGAAALLAGRYMKKAARRKRAVAICAFLVLAIGMSRIFLGAHWANDVVGGYLYGICILLAAQFWRQRIVGRSNRSY